MKFNRAHRNPVPDKKDKRKLGGTKLTDNQQIVLGALKADQNGWDPFFTIWHMMENDEMSNMPTKQQFQVLAAFAEWGMKEVSE